MGCFLGGIHDSSRKLLCPFYIWLPSPSTSAGLTRQTNPRPGPQHLGPDTAEAAHSPEGRHLYWAADLTGTINGDPESVASLHWDRGALLGVLQYRGAELHLQPLEGGALNSAGGPGAHILRRKSPFQFLSFSLLSLSPPPFLWKILASPCFSPLLYSEDSLR